MKHFPKMKKHYMQNNISSGNELSKIIFGVNKKWNKSKKLSNKRNLCQNHAYNIV